MGLAVLSSGHLFVVYTDYNPLTCLAFFSEPEPVGDEMASVLPAVLSVRSAHQGF